MISRDEIFGRVPRRLSRGDFFGAAGASLGVIAACGLLLWRDPSVFWNDDYQISILPVFADVARSWSEGHLPLLSAYSWVCSNLAGEFQYGTFSVFLNALIVLIWKFPLTFPQQAAALSITHLVVLATGTYLLARDRDLKRPLSVMAAWCAALSGWIICWGATDWFGALGAFSWLPWAWWGMERALDPRCGRWRFVWPAPFVYLLVTGGFPYTVLMLGLLTVWLAIKSLGQTKKFASIVPLIVGSLLGLGLSAPAWLALLDYMQGSAREVQPASAHLQWLVPLTSLPGFILPNWTVHWTDFSTRLVLRPAIELACGLAAPALLLAGIVACGRSLVRQWKWELGLLLAVLVIFMLPSASVFRWSFRWLPFGQLILALCAAEAWRAMDRERECGTPRSRWLFNAGAWAFGLVALTAIAMVLARTGGQYAWPLTGIMFAIAAVWGLVDAAPQRFRALQSWMPAAVTVIALLATFFCIPPNTGVPKFNFDQKLLSPAPLDPHRLYLSIYPAPEYAYRSEAHRGPVGQLVRPGSTSMWAAVHLINGYSPIRAAGVAREFATAIHGEIDLDEASYLIGWQAGPNGELAALGIDGIIVAKEAQLVPKPAAEWRLAYATDEGRVYHRRGRAVDRVRSVTSLDSRPNEQFVPAVVRIIEDSRNRVVADIEVPAGGERPALITFSRPYFRGYRAHIGAASFNVGSYRGLMPTVEVPPGTHGHLILTYRPWWLVWGGAVAGFSALLLAAFAFLAMRHGRGDQ